MSDLFYFISEKGYPKWDNSKAVEWLLKNEGKKCYADLGRETGVRTGLQNNSIHLYCKLLAEELNAGGFPCKFQLGEHVIDLDWDTYRVKENLWKPIQKALLGKKSTTELSKIEDIDKVYEHLNRFFSEKPFMFHIPFPSQQNK